MCIYMYCQEKKELSFIIQVTCKFLSTSHASKDEKVLQNNWIPVLHVCYIITAEAIIF